MSIHWGGRGPGHVSRWSLAAGGFSPLSLFAANEPGAWYDPSDLTTMFQDSAGTTPVTATGQTVGLLLDKSQGLVLGPELVTNGDFSSATGWTLGAGWSIGGGQLVGTNVTSTSAATQTITTGLGKTFLVTYTIVSITSGQVSVGLGPSLGTTRASAGTYTEYFVGTGATNGVSVYQRVSTTNAIIDNISVRELPGNHLTQSVLSNRPIYGIEPFGGRRNFARFTEQFDNAAWASANTGGTGVAPVVTPDAALAPDGTMTADRIVFSLGGGTTTADLSRRRQVTTASNGIIGTGTYSFWARTTDGVSSVNILRENSDGFAGTQITVTGSWQRFTVTSTTYTTGSPFGLGLRGGQTPAMPNTADILIWGAQLETGSTATAYQRVTDQWNVTQAGVPSVGYLQFDGSDDWLVSPTITPGIDKAQVFAGVRKLSDAATGMLAETGAASPFATNGAFGMYAPITAGGANYAVISRGSSPAQANTAGSFAAPITNVLTGLGDISGDSVILRVNGTQAASSTADQGTGNFAANPLYIGRRSGTSLPLNGRIYSLIVRFGANLSADTITQTETWVNSKTGAY